jgi:exopolysaccharide biosynthesis polyprenyl glycosylphosphotransferase
MEHSSCCKKADSVASRQPWLSGGDADGAQVHVRDAHQHWPIKPVLRVPERRRKSRPNLGQLPSCPSSDINSETLLPRSYLMTSKTAWIVVDFAITLCCGCVAILASEPHLRSLSVWPLLTAVGLLVNLLSIVKVVLFAFCVAALSGILGLQPFLYLHTISSELLLLVSSVSLAAFGVDGLLRLFPSPTSTNIIFEIILTCSALFLCRTLWRRQSDANFDRNIAGRNILIVGTDRIGRDVKDHLSTLRYLGFRFKGFVAMNEDADETKPTGDNAIVGNLEHLISLARSRFVDEIIFSRRPATPHILADVLIQAETAGIDVRLIPSLSETLQDRSDLEYLGNLPTIVLHRCTRRAVSNLVKRAIDIALAGIGITIMSPVFLVIAILIKLQSPGPVLHRSKRVGYKGNAFNCYKFRSMNENAESQRGQLAHLNERHDILFKIAKDPRVTKVGAFLRKYSLDELPQLWNVLNGDMSLVGPRPSIASEVAQYKLAHLRRLDVIPGMTGLWQVEARKDPSFESYVNLDSKYVRDWSIWLDCKILARTIGAVLKGTGS